MSNEEIVNAIAETFNDDSPIIKAAALYALAEISLHGPITTAIPGILNLLNDSNPGVVISGIHALKMIGPTDVVDSIPHIIISCFGYDYTQVRINAIELITEWSSTIPTIVPELYDILENNNSIWVSVGAAKCLYEIGLEPIETVIYNVKAGIEQGSEEIQFPGYNSIFLNPTNSIIKSEVCDLIKVAVGNETAADTVKDFVESEEDKRRMIFAYALAGCETVEINRYLLILLRDDSPEIRAAAIQAIGMYPYNRKPEELVTELTDIAEDDPFTQDKRMFPIRKAAREIIRE